MGQGYVPFQGSNLPIACPPNMQGSKNGTECVAAVGYYVDIEGNVTKCSRGMDCNVSAILLLEVNLSLQDFGVPVLRAKTFTNVLKKNGALAVLSPRLLQTWKKLELMGQKFASRVTTVHTALCVLTRLQDDPATHCARLVLEEKITLGKLLSFYLLYCRELLSSYIWGPGFGWD